MKKGKLVKIIVIVFIVFVLVNGLGTAGYLLNYRGYFSKFNGKVYAASEQEEIVESPLKGKHVLFLGSSVTKGERSKGVSFVEYLGARDGITYVKEAVSGTTLVDNGENSYVQRLINNVNANEAFDLVVVQLSTNDASQNLELGALSSSQNLEDFDTSTITGAMEYIIAYCQNTWNCPVVFYTSPQYDSSAYSAMVSVMPQLEDKWGIEVIDMWNELSTDIPEYSSYMADKIHPTQAGYLKWWTPFFEEKLYALCQ